MTPESITVGLEWAKKLKEAGWPQDQSQFHWLRRGDQWDVSFWREGGRLGFDEGIASPTAEEILRRLPEHFQVWRSHGMWSCDNGLDQSQWMKDYDSAANAAASMYVYLAEHSLLPKP
jgi:hypothetical protein